MDRAQLMAFGSEFIGSVKGVIVKLWDAFIVGITGTVVSDFFPSMTEGLVEAVRSLGASLSNLAGLTADSFKKEGLRMLGAKLASAAFDALMRVVDIVNECIRTRSLEPIYVRPRPADWKQEADIYLTYETLLCLPPGAVHDGATLADLQKKGVIPRWIAPLPSVLFAENIHRLISAAPTVRRMCPPHLTREVDTVLQKLTAWTAQNASIMENSQLRVEPFGVFFHGPPHTGKTEICTKLFRSLGAKEGYPTTPESCCSWQIANFQDTFTQTAWAILFDDIDSTPVAVGQSPNVFSDVINLGNIKPPVS